MLATAWVDDRRASARRRPSSSSTAPAGPSPGTRRSRTSTDVAAIVFVFWNPDRGIRMQGEYEENPDGTLRATHARSPAGAASSLFQACQNMMLAAHALGVSSLFTTFFGLCAARGQGAAARAAAHVPRVRRVPRLRRRAARASRRRKPLEEVVHLERLGRCRTGPMTTIPRIVSADDHVVEPPDVFTSRLPAKYRDIGPRVVRAPVAEMTFRGGKYAYAMGDERRRPARRLVALRGPARSRTPASARVRGLRARGRAGRADDLRRDAARAATSSGPRLDDMDLNWVEASLCFPTFPRFCGQTFLEADDKDLALLCVQAYNDWMVEEWCAGSRRTAGPAVPDPAVGPGARGRRGAPQRGARRAGGVLLRAAAEPRAAVGARRRPATGTRSSPRATRPAP